jgi:hypothetical protein
MILNPSLMLFAILGLRNTPVKDGGLPVNGTVLGSIKGARFFIGKKQMSAIA